MTLELSAAEQAFLLNILERADRHLLGEIRRTESIDFRHDLEQDEQTLCNYWKSCELRLRSRIKRVKWRKGYWLTDPFDPY